MLHTQSPRSNLDEQGEKRVFYDTLLKKAKFRLLKNARYIDKGLREEVERIDMVIAAAESGDEPFDGPNLSRTISLISRYLGLEFGKFIQDYERDAIGRHGRWISHRVGWYRQDKLGIDRAVGHVNTFYRAFHSGGFFGWGYKPKTVDPNGVPLDEVRRLVDSGPVLRWETHVRETTHDEQKRLGGKRITVDSEEEAVQSLRELELIEPHERALTTLLSNLEDRLQQAEYLRYHAQQAMGAADRVTQSVTKSMRRFNGRWEQVGEERVRILFSDEGEAVIHNGEDILDIRTTPSEDYRNFLKGLYYRAQITEEEPSTREFLQAVYQLAGLRYIRHTFERLAGAELDDERVVAETFIGRIEKAVDMEVAGAEPEDYLHPHLKNTLKWIRKLMPDASEALMIAAAHHDIDRAFEVRIPKYARGNELTDEGGAAFRSAGIFNDTQYVNPDGSLTMLLEEWGADEFLVDDVKYLITRHEIGSDKPYEQLHMEANILKVADTASFLEDNFDTYLAQSVRKTGSTLGVERKIVFMWGRLTPEEQHTIQPLYDSVQRKLEEKKQETAD
jgi:hypothetical protein